MLGLLLADVANARFSRHETFAPRFGWLHKGYLAVREDSEVFLAADASVTLGVGKNMVNAIRYWSTAFKLTIERPKGGTSRANIAIPTWRATWLLDENGADPYLEDPASLWLLHWWLLSEQEGVRCDVPTWWVAFHALQSARFTEEQLSEVVMREVARSGWAMPVKASVNKDADCLTKMYAPRKAAANSPGSFEDLLDCPFRELGLLESVPNDSGRTRLWRFPAASRVALAPSVLAYASLDYAASTGDKAGSISLARLANEPGGPGRAFRIREAELAIALAHLCRTRDDLRITEAAGHRSLRFDEDPRSIGWDILDAQYGNTHLPWRCARADWMATHGHGDGENTDNEQLIGATV